MGATEASQSYKSHPHRASHFTGPTAVQTDLGSRTGMNLPDAEVGGCASCGRTIPCPQNVEGFGFGSELCMFP